MFQHVMQYGAGMANKQRREVAGSTLAEVWSPSRKESKNAGSSNYAT